jgi:hypothetical protein
MNYTQCMQKVIANKWIRKSLIFIGIGFFLLVVSLCVHFNQPTDHSGDAHPVICDLSEVISSVSISKESMGLLFLLTLLALASLTALNTSSCPKAEICLKLLLLPKITIKEKGAYRVWDHFLQSLRRGIIHPKLYSTVLS